MVGCGYDYIEVSEFERQDPKCDVNEGVAGYIIEEIDTGDHVEVLVTGVRCNNGAEFKEPRDETYKRR
ncbi:MAG: hypothetical protein R3230_00150 [Nitrosopumilaceae archaeon]|nr:hypothetical protein [Nitrosopumilaceae archaeon]